MSRTITVWRLMGIGPNSRKIGNIYFGSLSKQGLSLLQYLAHCQHLEIERNNSNSDIQFWQNDLNSSMKRIDYTSASLLIKASVTSALPSDFDNTSSSLGLLAPQTFPLKYEWHLQNPQIKMPPFAHLEFLLAKIQYLY